MNEAVDEVKAFEGQTIEQIMFDMVNNQPDGLGPCTSIPCLLESSARAARTFILEKQMTAAAQHTQYHDGMEYDETGYYDADGKYHDAAGTASGDMCQEMCMYEVKEMGFTNEDAGMEFM